MPDDAPTAAPTPAPAAPPDAPAEQGGHGSQGGHGGHGTSTAAWISTLGVTFGALVVAVCLIFQWLPGIVVGAVIIVLAALAWPVLERAGLGATAPQREFTGEARAVR